MKLSALSGIQPIWPPFREPSKLLLTPLVLRLRTDFRLRVFGPMTFEYEP